MAHQLPEEVLMKLQKSKSNIRNVCILAHVDHGKTTLTDGLISSNGIISSKLAGSLRYMDSMPEEQRRGITMKASSITLVYKGDPHRELKRQAADPTKAVPYLVNLVDSPGHVDFSADVSTAVRVCDGAVLVVDVVEGVCIQTHAVLRQAWEDGVVPCLVLNKIDRLVTELGMTPADAYNRLQRVLEHVNVIASSLLSARQIEAAEEEEEGAGAAAAAPAGSAAFGTDAAAKEEKAVFFSPTKGNVVFASAGAGWAFSLDDFASLLADKLPVPRPDLRRALWGAWGFSKAEGKVVPLPPGSKKAPMFVDYVLASIWRVYAAAVLRPSVERMGKVVKAFGLTLPEGTLEHPDGAARVKGLMMAWLPLSKAVLSMVTRCLPSPAEAQSKRLDLLLGPPSVRAAALVGAPPAAVARQERVVAAIRECDNSEEAPVVVFITKLVAQAPATGLTRSPSQQDDEWTDLREDAEEDLAAVLGVEPSSHLVQEVRGALDEGTTASYATLASAHEQCSEEFYAFGRVFAGTVRPGQQLFLVGGTGVDDTGGLPLVLSRVRAVHPGAGVRPCMMMGRNVHPMAGVPAGNVVCLTGLKCSLMKNATVSTSPLAPPFADMPSQTTPLLKVTLAPKAVGDLPALQRGLQLLNQADPCAAIGVSPDGQLQLAAVGELHLANCVEDVVKRFALVPVTVSPPLLSFRETIAASSTHRSVTAVGAAMVACAAPREEGAPPPDIPPCLSAALPCPGAAVAGASRGTASTSVTWDAGAGCMRATSAVSTEGPEKVTVSVGVTLHPVPHTVQEGIESHAAVLARRAGNSSAAEQDAMLAAAMALEEVSTLEEVLEGDAAWPARLQCLLTSDPSGSCLLTATGVPTLTPVLTAATGGAAASEDAAGVALRDPRVQAAVHQGFLLACRTGPITSEPLYRVCADITSLSLRAGVGGAARVPISALALAVSAAVRAAVHYGVATHGARLVEPLYKAELQCSGGRSEGGEQLGNLYGVLSKRRGVVQTEGIIPGTSTFLITALLPVHESLGFAQDLRDATSGAASAPQMVFSHWAGIPSDPFSLMGVGEEGEAGLEVAELSATASHMRNMARRYMDAARRRKGLRTHDKVVVHAEKQRTLARKK